MADTVQFSNMTTAFPHPYYPLGVELPGYLANESSVLSLVGRFAVCWVTVLGIAFLIINRVRPSASRSDRLAFLWFCLSRSFMSSHSPCQATEYQKYSCIDPSLLRGLLRAQSCTCCRRSWSFRPAMERILPRRLALLDLRYVSRVHGICNSGRSNILLYTAESSIGLNLPVSYDNSSAGALLDCS